MISGEKREKPCQLSWFLIKASRIYTEILHRLYSRLYLIPVTSNAEGVQPIKGSALKPEGAKHTDCASKWHCSCSREHGLRSKLN